MATDRMAKLIALAAEHPEMTIRDAIVATDRVPMTEHVIVENKNRAQVRGAPVSRFLCDCCAAKLDGLFGHNLSLLRLTRGREGIVVTGITDQDVRTPIVFDACGSGEGMDRLAARLGYQADTIPTPPPAGLGIPDSDEGGL